MGGKAKVGRSYRYYTGKHLLYPMGHGLSYTTFAITESKSDGTANAADTGDKSGAVKGQVLAVGQNTTVKLTVANTGDRDGDEVIMAMFIPHTGTVVPPSAPAARLQQQMFGFERVSVACTCC